MATWMIYGAYGYTGQLVAQEAVARGHRPILSGRSEDKLSAMAGRFGLDHRAAALNDSAALAAALKGVDLVFHAAGPFADTAASMVKACLAARASYLDVTGEIPVFERNFSLDKKARDLGVALISGVGFDVVPTDCLAAYVAARIPQPTTLRIAFAGLERLSRGTLLTMLRHLHRGVMVRRNGHLVALDKREPRIRAPFPDRVRNLVPITWGDLSTAYHSTGIPNITVYLALTPRKAALVRVQFSVVGALLGIPVLRRAALAFVKASVTGPGAQVRQAARSVVWAQAANNHERVEAVLETLEGYTFTASAGVRCVEKVLSHRPTGALTPSQAFGPDFVLEIPGTTRRLLP